MLRIHMYKICQRLRIKVMSKTAVMQIAELPLLVNSISPIFSEKFNV